MDARSGSVAVAAPASLRAAIGVAAAGNVAVAVAFATQQAWAGSAWPWPTGRLSLLFLAAMLAAVGVAAAWIAVSGELASLPAGFLNLAVTLGGVAAFLLLGGAQVDPGIGLGVAVALLAVVNLALFGVTLRLPTASGEPLPRLLRGSYAVFTAVLLAVGLALILRVDGVLPWPVDPDTSVVLGWMFFGDAWYFAYALVRPGWRAQLWSFLGYDAVLLGPLVAHLPNVDAALRDNLLLYLAVLTYSAGLGVWYLLLNPRTRGWAAPQRTAGVAGSVGD